MESKGDKFKAYTLCVFALAVVDEAARSHMPAADSAVGYYLLAIWDKFKTFDFESSAVVLDSSGCTHKRQKRPEGTAVEIWIHETRNNSSNNVSVQRLKACREKVEKNRG
jgi:hypothetical protein